MRQRCCIGLVAEHQENVVGYAVYEFHPKRIDLLNLAVRPSSQGSGVGKAIVDKLKGKLCEQRRKKIQLKVRETNLNAQLFFRSQGFRAIAVVESDGKFSDEDNYLMEYHHHH